MDITESSFISALANGTELGYIADAEIDMDIGDTNDFELTISTEEWNTGKYAISNRIFMPETEYGGLIEDMEVVTKDDAVLLRGYTWRGLLNQKVIEPPEGAAYLYLSGELNEVIGKLLGNRYGELFAVEDENTELTVENWKVDRYTTLYAAMVKLLENHGYKIQIRYVQGEKTETGKVYIGAVPIKDYSDELEYSQDAGVDFNIRDYRRGINHLICGGAGELTKRLILHLYVQPDGSIETIQYYTGLAERVAFYENPNADTLEQLEEEGQSYLATLQNYKKLNMSVENVDVGIGDIVGGREYITGIELKKPVIQKILRQTNGEISIEYKLKGED